MMAFTAMLSELYDAFRRKVGADEPPAKTAAEAVVIEDAWFHSIDGKFDALGHTMDQRFDALSQRFDVLNQPFDGLSRAMDQRFSEFGQGMGQRFDALSRMIDERLATINQYFAAMDVPLVRLETKVAEMDAQHARLEAKTATEFRRLRWGLDIVTALLFGLVTKVILDWAMP
jgi:hypothetical protein